MAVSTIKGAKFQNVTASDFITLNSGFSLTSDVNMAIQGNVLFGHFTLKNTNTLSVNSRHAIGTVKAPYKPKRVIGTASGLAYEGVVSTDGTFYVAPVYTMQANDNQTVTFFWVI